MVAQGDRAAEVELTAHVRELVERAQERLRGNDRLHQDLSELLGEGAEAEQTAGEPPVQVDDGALARLRDQLERLGVALNDEGGSIRAAMTLQLDDLSQLRALALVDQRAARSPGDAAAAARSAVAQLLAETGLAGRCMRDLGAGGPLQGPAMSLTASARQELFDAALDAGTRPSPDWADHPVLRHWLDDAPAPPGDAENLTTTEVLSRLASLATRRRELESRIADSRRAARSGFVHRAQRAIVDLEEAADAYVQLWLGLRRSGIDRLAAPGSVVDAEALDPMKFEIVGESDTQSFVVRFGGVSVDGEVIQRARVEADR